MPLASSARAVVTGTGSGLGRAFCIELAKRGARVVISDVDEAAWAALGGVDLLINNAGVAVGGSIGQIPLEDWRWIVDVNLWGPIYGCHTFVPRLRQQGSGHVLNVASAAGLFASPQMGPYNVTKSGVVALSETLFSELQPVGIGVSVLCPTFFETNIAKASRMSGDPGMLNLVQGLMSGAGLQAADVARIALDGVAKDELYILPHADGRWMWRLKRLNPAFIQSLTQRVFAWRAGRST